MRCCWSCWEVDKELDDAATSAYRIGKAMQLGTQYLHVEKTDRGYIVDFDKLRTTSDWKRRQLIGAECQNSL